MERPLQVGQFNSKYSIKTLPTDFVLDLILRFFETNFKKYLWRKYTSVLNLNVRLYTKKIFLLNWK